MLSRVFHLVEHDPKPKAKKPVRLFEDVPMVMMTAEQLEQLRNDPEWVQTDVRGNRHGADASQPGPAHPPGDSRHLEGAT